MSAARQVEALARGHGDGRRGDVRARGDRWSGDMLERLGINDSLVFTNNIENLGGGHGVKVGKLVADLAPEHAARVQGDGAQPHQPGPAGRLLKHGETRV